MKCYRCSAELPDSATTCFACGQNLQDRTQPESTHYSSSSFSYLPAGAPPWPTTVPTLKETNNVNTISSTSTSENLNETRGTKRSVGTIITMVGVILLVPILGAALTLGALFSRGQLGATNNTASAAVPNASSSSATPQATPQTSGAANQLPTPNSSKKISDTDLNILLQYPDNWDPDQINKTANDTVLDLHPHTQLGMAFYVFHLSSTRSAQFQTADDVNLSQFQDISQIQGVASLQPSSNPSTQMTLAGTTWTQKEASFQTTGGDTYHLTVITTERNKTYYTVLFWTPEVYYTEAMGKYIQPMLQSIQFLK